MSVIVLLTMVVLASLGELASARGANLDAWVQFKRQHSKLYADKAEDAWRFSLFLAAKDRIERHNANSSHSYKLGLNHLSDWTPEECARSSTKRRIITRPSASDKLTRSISSDLAPLPKEVDWRKVPNRVTPVKDQGNCSSGHVFAAISILEGQQVVRNFTKKIVPLSAQEVLDCSPWASCAGGDPTMILEEIPYVGGVMSERDYEYVAPAESWCRFDKSKSVMTSAGYELPNVSHRDFIERWVASYGPIGTYINVVEEVRHYKSGVFASESCKSGNAIQPLSIVGYGTDPQHGDYWILKNSWGSDWGENGYMRIQRGSDMCLVEQVPYRAGF